MDDVTRNRIDAFDRCSQWFIDNAVGVNSNTKLKNLVVDFDAKLATLHTEAGEQSGAVSESEEQTGVKGDSREDCIAIAIKVNKAAKAAEIEQPGIQARYPYPRNLNDEDLVNLLRSYAIGGVDDDQIIRDYGAPTDWVAQCTALANAFEAAGQAQAAAKGDKVGKRALVLSRRPTDAAQTHRRLHHRKRRRKRRRRPRLVEISLTRRGSTKEKSATANALGHDG